MKTKTYIVFVILFIIVYFSSLNFLFGKEIGQPFTVVKTDDVETFKALLNSLKESAVNNLFALHFQSIIDVINAKGNLTPADSAFISATLPVFSDTSVVGNGAKFSSYTNRSRFLIISWVSPIDGAVSFFRLKLPKNWDQGKSYPLYVDLHGLTSTAVNPIEFMTTGYRSDPSTTFAFEDGYQLSPWGRGNLWYLGISETDIWEGIGVIESMVNIDPSRKYLVGHSMGGYGTWMIASKSADVWAAIGIEAGALWYGNDNMLSSEKINNLKELPTYFVVGTSDGLYDINLQAYNLLKDAGDQNIEFVTFDGGHVKLAPNVENMYLWLKQFVNENYTSVGKLDKIGDNSLLIFPNPVRTDTNIQIKLGKINHVRLNLYNINGKKVATVVDKYLGTGETTIPWSRGNLYSGIYTYSFEIGTSVMSGKLILY